MRVYLAGPIFGCNDEECKGWRQQLKSDFPEIDWVDPMERDFRGKESISVEQIIEGDKEAIDGCEAMIANVLQPSAGTAMEILYAHSQGIPVVVIDGSGGRISPWIIYHASCVSQTIRGAVEHCLRFVTK